MTHQVKLRIHLNACHIQHFSKCLNIKHLPCRLMWFDQLSSFVNVLQIIFTVSWTAIMSKLWHNREKKQLNHLCSNISSLCLVKCWNWEEFAKMIGRRMFELRCLLAIIFNIWKYSTGYHMAAGVQVAVSSGGVGTNPTTDINLSLLLTSQLSHFVINLMNFCSGEQQRFILSFVKQTILLAAELSFFLFFFTNNHNWKLPSRTNTVWTVGHREATLEHLGVKCFKQWSLLGQVGLFLRSGSFVNVLQIVFTVWWMPPTAKQEKNNLPSSFQHFCAVIGQMMKLGRIRQGDWSQNVEAMMPIFLQHFGMLNRLYTLQRPLRVVECYIWAFQSQVSPNNTILQFILSTSYQYLYDQ